MPPPTPHPFLGYHLRCLLMPSLRQMLYDDFQTDVEDRARKAGVRVSHGHGARSRRLA